MVKVAIALLRLPDSRIVFQRRTKNARIGPGKLGFFGGHVEAGETYDQAIRRELAEETSLKVSTLDIRHISSFELMSDIGEGKVRFHLYEADVKNSDFKVYEGVRSEVYGFKEAHDRDDLTTSAKYALAHVVKD